MSALNTETDWLVYTCDQQRSGTESLFLSHPKMRKNVWSVLFSAAHFLLSLFQLEFSEM